MLMTHFEVETRKFWIKSSVALCSVDSWVLVHYCIVNVNLTFNLTTTIMFVVIIKLKSHFLSLVTHTYYSQCYSTHETTANSDWPITDHRMRKEAFICERDF